MRSQCFVAEEDSAWNTIFYYMRKGGPITKMLAPSQQMKAGDKEKYVRFLERLSNCHKNDMQNITPFLLIAFLYMLCGFNSATIYFYTFTVSRVLHSIIYLVLKLQPFRSICYFVGVYCTGTMALQLIMHANSSVATAN